MHAQPPAVDLAQIDLLPILIVTIRGKQGLAVEKVFIQIAPLRERRAVQEPLAVQLRGRREQRAVTVRLRSLQGPAQLVVTRERTARGCGRRGEPLGFSRQKVLEETGRASHGLAGVIDDVVEPWQSLGQESREQLDARRVPQIETV